MHENLLLLKRSIEADLDTIERIYGQLEGAELKAETSKETIIVVGYRLHNLYNAFESIFRHVAKTFENQLDEARGWHSELLRRMRLDLRPLRPAVIDGEAYARLDELRGFRHVFRSLYGDELDPARMDVTLRKAHELRELWPDQAKAFLEFLDQAIE